MKDQCKCSDVPRDLYCMKDAVKRALKEKPYRKFHGYKSRTTAYTSFWIDEETCVVRDWKYAPIQGQPAIPVHSHETNIQTFNAMDVALWHKLVITHRSTAAIVLFPESNETMDVLAIEKKEENRDKLLKFVQLTKQNLLKELEISRYEGGYMDKDRRNALRVFAKKYGLIFLENVSYASERGNHL